MKLSEKQSKWEIPQYVEELKFTEKELIARVKDYLTHLPEKLYCGDIVCKDKRTKLERRANGYLTADTQKTFCEVICETVLASPFHVKEDEKCTYNAGSRADKIKELKDKLINMSKMKEYYGESETKMVHCLCVQKNISGYTTLDFQVPTTNGGSDKIDLILKKDDMVYMTEVKKFNSDETLLRCVLEIQTYYQKLNKDFFDKYKCTEKTLKKAILIDESSFAHNQLSLEWAQRLVHDERFGVEVLILSRDDKSFYIKQF